MTAAIALPRLGTFPAWREAARGLLAAGLSPGQVAWRFEGAAVGLFDAPAPAAPPPGSAAAPRTTKAFLSLAEAAAPHKDPATYAHLYSLLWRMQRDAVDLADRSDPDAGPLIIARKALARDIHKMHAFVRFFEVPGPGARRRFAAWFEPDHHIVGTTAGFFARRFGDMDWAIATPHGTARFEDGALTVTADIARPDLPGDAAMDLWQTYYASIFNPARLKVQAMQSEMPKKYWRNLPEASLIPEMIANAQARTDAMRATAPSQPPRYAARATAPVARREDTDMDLFAPQTLDAVRQDAAACTRCPLYGPATQTVFGEGPQDAPLMVVGEQPGDQEDLAGRPFVGPAGQLFDQLAEEAGMDRSRAYVTNAVKHFKFVQRGKRRIHQRPGAGEVSHCRWWLELEREVIKPRLTLALGATALHALTGNGAGILKRRGGVEPARDGGPVFVTVHPSYLLRLPSAEARQAEERAFVADLRAALAHPALAA